MRALIIEDNPHLSYVWKEALCEVGFDVSCVKSCIDATQTLLKQNFDVCLLDLHVEDGITTGIADWIKIRSPKTQTIAVTGTDFGPNGELSLKHGFDLVFRKPMDVAHLIAVTCHVAVAA